MASGEKRMAHLKGALAVGFSRILCAMCDAAKCAPCEKAMTPSKGPFELMYASSWRKAATAVDGKSGSKYAKYPSSKSETDPNSAPAVSDTIFIFVFGQPTFRFAHGNHPLYEFKGVVVMIGQLVT